MSETYFLWQVFSQVLKIGVAAAADKAMRIAADCCIYTNDTFTKKSLKAKVAPREELLALSEEEEEGQEY